MVYELLRSVFQIRKYFLRLGIRGSVILNYGSGRPIMNPAGSGSYLDIFVAVEKICQIVKFV
jgi:hypothetical protein